MTDERTDINGLKYKRINLLEMRMLYLDRLSMGSSKNAQSIKVTLECQTDFVMMQLITIFKGFVSFELSKGPLQFFFFFFFFFFFCSFYLFFIFLFLLFFYCVINKRPLFWCKGF